jgi:superfamily II DNA/RNA helicase
MNSKAQKIYKQMSQDMVVDILRLAETYPRSRLKQICKDKGIPYKKNEKYTSLLMKTRDYIDSATAEAVITQRLRMQQITGGFLTNDLGEVIPIDDSKAQAIKDYIQDYPEPVVIFCKFLPEIELLQRILGKDRKVEVLSGKTKKKNRGKLIRKFQKGKIDVLIAQIRAGSVGINLTRSCMTLFYSITDSYDDYVQARSRTDRNGQMNKPLFIHVMVKNTVDEEILETVRIKQQRADRILDSRRKSFTKKTTPHIIESKGGSRMKAKNVNTGKEYIVINKDENTLEWPKNVKLLDSKDNIKIVPLGAFHKHYETINEGVPIPKQEKRKMKALAQHIGEEVKNTIDPGKTESKQNLRDKQKEKMKKQQQRKEKDLKKRQEEFKDTKDTQPKAPAGSQKGDIVTLKELCSQLGIEDSKARKILRKANVEQPFNRWEWDKKQHKEIVEQVTKLLKK